MAEALLGLGSNLGDRIQNMTKAINMLNESAIIIRSCSSVYETDPWGFDSGDSFLNAVVAVSTPLTPAGLLSAILNIETLMGRERSGEGYVSRIIDIDILFYDSLVINEEGLRIPHPLLHERRFVLVPLKDLVPDFIHPVTGKSVKEMLLQCLDRGAIRLHSTPLSAKL